MGKSNKKGKNNKAGMKINIKTIILLICAVVLLAAVVTAGVMIYQHYKEKKAQESLTYRYYDAVLNENGDVVIDKSTISDKYLTYIRVEGLPDDIIAIKAPDGSIKTALNCCMECYYTGNSRYLYVSKEMLECFACGMTYNVADMGSENENGCKPIPITDDDREETQESIIIPKKIIDYWTETLEFWREDAHLDDMDAANALTW